MGYATTNPYTGEVIKTFPDATDSYVADAITKAHHAFLDWKLTSFSARASILQNAANILRNQKDEFAHLLTLEMGRLVGEAYAEIELSAQIFEYYVHNAERLLEPETLPVPILKKHQPSLCMSRWEYYWPSSRGTSRITRLHALSHRSFQQEIPFS